MKYFTRELHELSQPKRGLTEDEEEASWPRIKALWDSAQAEYRRVFASVVPSLPAGARTFFENVHMHDARILSVNHGPDNTVAMVFDTKGSFLPGKRFFVTFHGVKTTEGLTALEGEWWVYQEVHPSNLGAFDLQVLCARTEFRVVADDVSCGTVE
jgi:hypothetical protein